MSVTVNIPILENKLSRLQKTIIEVMKEQIKDNFWGIRLDLLSYEVAKKTQTDEENYITLGRRKQILYNKAVKGDIESNWAFYKMNKMRSGRLTDKFRASFSRSLKRLEERGIIKRIVMELERREGKSFWIQYVNVRKASRGVFTDDYIRLQGETG